METCESCRFYFPIDKAGNQGECRWEPPKLFALPGRPAIAGGPSMIELRALWPPVLSGAWCGRYEERTGPIDIPELEKRLKLAEDN